MSSCFTFQIKTLVSFVQTSKIVNYYLCAEFHVEHNYRAIQSFDWRRIRWTLQSDLWIWLWFLENRFISISGRWVSRLKYFDTLIASDGSFLFAFTLHFIPKNWIWTKTKKTQIIYAELRPEIPLYSLWARQNVSWKSEMAMALTVQK